MESNQEFNKLFKEYEAKVDQANQTYKDLSEIMKKINKFLVNDRENLYKIESMMVKYKKNESEIVKFNVGGTTFSTHKTTVNKKIVKPDTNGNEFYEPNLLQGLISGIIDVNYDEDNKTIFIDRDPKYFNFILNYLRFADSGNIEKFKLPKDIDSLNDIYEEADYYQLDGLKDIIYPKKFSDSLILSVSEAYKLNSLCEFSKNDSFSLIYRGSRDGFSAQNFHSKCDNVRKTLIIIKSTQSYIFGGYTEEVWNHSGNYKHDVNSFLFSLVNMSKNPLKIKYSGSSAIYCNSNYGPTFGSGHDLHISSDSNANSSSYSNLGCNFVSPHYKSGTIEAQNFLAGSYNFQVGEIEVYRKL